MPAVLTLSTIESMSEAPAAAAAQPVFAIFAEESSNASSSASGGFTYSLGNGDQADGFGAVIGWDAEIIGIGISVRSNPSGTLTVEAYKGADADNTSSATGVSVSLSSGERHAFADFSGSPVAVSAGDWITFQTTAVSGTVNGLRVILFIRITATIP